MSEAFATVLAVGGTSNSLGRAEEVVRIVLADESRLDELFECLFEDDAWLRMRAVDALEKVCRVHPDWLKPYVGRLLDDVAAIDQASIQWHLAQMFGEIDLAAAEKKHAIAMLRRNLADTRVDWIVSSNSMETLVRFVEDGDMAATVLVPLLQIQRTHRSKAVVKRATRILEAMESTSA
jgi:hypothetical protein